MLLRYVFLQCVLAFVVVIATGQAVAMESENEKYMQMMKKNLTHFYLENGIGITHYKTSSQMMSMIFHLEWSRDDYLYGWGLYRQFVAKLMTKQTTRYSRDELNRRIINTSANFQCYPSHGCYNSGHLRCRISAPRELFQDQVQLLHSVVSEPKFSKNDLEVEKTRAITAVKSCANQDDWQLTKLIDTLYFSPGRFHYFYYDLIPQIKKLTTEDLMKEYKKFLNAKRMQFFVASADKASEVKRHISKYFLPLSSWHYEGHVSYHEDFPEHTSYQDKRLVYKQKDLSNVTVNLRFATPSKHSVHWEPWNLLLDILYDQYFEMLRTNRSLSYAPIVRGGSISFSTSYLKESMDTTREFLELMREDVLQGKDLDDFKNIFYAEHLEKQNTSSGIVNSLYFFMHPYHRGLRWSEFPKIIAKIDEDQLNFLARYYLRNFVIGIMGPKKLVGDPNIYINYFDPPVIRDYP